jgi:hypothetical protein
MMMKKKKIYLLYDFEELCGCFTTLEGAKKAAFEHISYLKQYILETSKRLGFENIEFEIYQDQGERRWLFGLLAKANGSDLHRRKIVIFEYLQNQYYSSIKRLIDQKAQKRN